MNTDDIDLLLKQHFQHNHEYLDDDGFTANVMNRIPQRRNLNPWVKQAIFWLPVLIASLFFLYQLPWREIVHSAVAFFITAGAEEFMIIAAAFFTLIMAYVAFTFLTEGET
jgi:hypothetical protein